MIIETKSSLSSPPLVDGIKNLRRMWGSNLGQVPLGGRWMHMARNLPSMLRLLSAAGSTAVVLPARRTSLLQGRLHKVSAHSLLPPDP